MTLHLPILCLALTAITALASQQQAVLMARAHGVRGAVTSVLQPTTDGLISYYAFDGNANDNFGTNNGTLFGSPVLTNGANGSANGAYYFNGSTQYISISNDPLYSVSATNYTIAFWIKAGAIRANSYDIIMGNSGDPRTAGGILVVGLDDGSYIDGVTPPALRRAITISGKTLFNRYYYYAVNGVLTNGQLTHVAFAYNGVTATTLIDGVVRSNVVSTSVNNSVGNYTPRNNVFGISEIGDYHLNRINAMFDNVRIYKRALTASEMTVIYNAEKP